MKDLNLTIEHFGEEINMRMLTAILLAALAPQRMKRVLYFKGGKGTSPFHRHPRYYSRPT
jgi:hypothetical protein